MLRLTCIRGWVAGAFLLMGSGASAQQGQKDEKVEFQQLVGHFTGFFQLLGEKTKPDIGQMLPYFAGDSVILDNQYYDGGISRFNSLMDYLLDITEFFYNNGVEQLEIGVSAPNAVLYGKAGDSYYAWIYQSFNYVFRDRKIDRHGWVELHARRDPVDGVLKIVSVTSVGGAPADDDGDQIADAFDYCIDTPAGAETGMNGCPLRVEQPRISETGGARGPIATRQKAIVFDGPGPQQPAEPGKVRGRRVVAGRRVVVDSRTPRPPSSRWSFDASYGILGEVSADNKTVAWNSGYSGNFGLHLHAARYLDIGAGVIHLYDPLGVSAFQTSVVNSLVANNIGLQNVTMSSDAFHYTMVYGSLGVGNYRSARAVVSLEPLAGMVYTNWFFPNQLGVTIQYTGEQAQTTKFSMATQPFFAEGLKAMLQLGMGEKGMVRLQMSAYYLQSNDQPVVNQELSFANSRGAAAVPQGQFRLIAAMVGLHFTLHRPGNF